MSFWTRTHVLYLLILAWVRASCSALRDAHVTAGMSAEACWTLAVEEVGQLFGVAYIKNHAFCRDRDGSTILEDNASYEIPASQLELLHPFFVRFQSCIEQHCAIRQIFLAGNVTIWSPIVSTGVKGVDSGDARKTYTRFTSTNGLLRTELEQNEERVWMAELRSWIYVWVDWLAVRLVLDKGRDCTSSKPEARGR